MSAISAYEGFALMALGVLTPAIGMLAEWAMPLELWVICTWFLVRWWQGEYQ
jgi:hypothetical protein